MQLPSAWQPLAGGSGGSHFARHRHVPQPRGAPPVCRREGLRQHSDSDARRSLPYGRGLGAGEQGAGGGRDGGARGIHPPEEIRRDRCVASGTGLRRLHDGRTRVAVAAGKGDWTLLRSKGERFESGSGRAAATRCVQCARPAALRGRVQRRNSRLSTARDGTGHCRQEGLRRLLCDATVQSRRPAREARAAHGFGNKVIDHERVSGVREQPFDVAVVYEVAGGLIDCTWAFAAE